MSEAEASRNDTRGVWECDALVRGLRETDPAACAELCRRFGPQIHRFATARLSGDGHLAEDIMLQTLVDAARRAKRFDARKTTFSAWLYGIARREIYRELRRQSRRKSVPASAQVPLESTREMSNGEDLAGRSAARLDARRQVAGLAALLSRIEFDILVLNCVEQLSAREIGQIVGRSERAVHSILHRARTKARETIGPDE
jgi:RNA polymerase sigma-70 factor (ECF subfamily)